MKHLKWISAVLILMIMPFISCSEDFEPLDPAVVIPDPDDNPDPNQEPGTFKVNFDGGTYSTTSTSAFISNGLIIINALRSQGDSFSILLQGTNAGNYAANDNLIFYEPVNSDFSYSGNHPSDPNANTGNIVITEIDAVNQTISGTFFFTGYWSDTTAPLPNKQFTNGVFTDLPYTSEAPADDTFFAKVNGQEFVDTNITTAEAEINNLPFLSIGAVNASQENISVSVRPNLTVGEYLITANPALDVVQVSYKPAGVSSSTSAQSGFVTITEKTATRIKGTFGAVVVVGTTTYQITTGTFDVAY